jgi:DnaJ-class molecular chaperone
MAHPPLITSESQIEHDVISTMLAALDTHQQRYPGSQSDMQTCVRDVMRMFKIERLPISKKLHLICDNCEGIGRFIDIVDGVKQTYVCPNCKGRGSKEF